MDRFVEYNATLWSIDQFKSQRMFSLMIHRLWTYCCSTWRLKVSESLRNEACRKIVQTGPEFLFFGWTLLHYTICEILYGSTCCISRPLCFPFDSTANALFRNLEILSKFFFTLSSSLWVLLFKFFPLSSEDHRKNFHDAPRSRFRMEEGSL